MHDIQRFAADLPARIPAVIARIKHLPLADKFGVDSLAQKSEGVIASTAQYLFATAPLWLGRIFDLFTAFILCIYFMLEGEFVYFYFLSFFSPEHRDRLAKTLVVAEVRMSSWFVGQVALMLILGICSTAAFALLHVRYFFLLGVLMGLFNIIPVVGGIITIVLAAAVAATDSWTKMIGVLIFYGIYIQIENAFLTPRIMRSRVNLMGLSVIVALLAGTALAGIVGAPRRHPHRRHDRRHHRRVLHPEGCRRSRSSHRRSRLRRLHRVRSRSLRRPGRRCRFRCLRRRFRRPAAQSADKASR